MHIKTHFFVPMCLILNYYNIDMQSGVFLCRIIAKVFSFDCILFHFCQILVCHKIEFVKYDYFLCALGIVGAENKNSVVA